MRGSSGRSVHGPASRALIAGAASAVLALALAGCDRGAPPGTGAAPAATTVALTDVEPFEAQVRTRPDDPRSWQGLGLAATRRLIESGDPAWTPVATDAFSHALALAPADPTTHIGRGTLALTLHRFAEAVDAGNTALAAAPQSPRALAVVVDGLIELGRYDEAGAALQSMLDHRPDLVALARLSYFRELHGDVDGAGEAIGAAAAAAGSGPDAGTVLTLSGDLALRRGNLRGARHAYTAAERAAPGNPATAVGRARLLAATGHTAAAIEHLERVLDRAPLPSAAVILADLRSAGGEAAAAQRAVTLVRSMLQLARSGGSTVDLEVALFEADHGDPAGAVSAAEAAYAERPDNVMVADALAWARYRAGDVAGADAASQQAIRLGTADQSVLVHAAAIAASAGDAGRARTHLTRAFEGSPWFAIGLRDVATALAGRLGVQVPHDWRAS